VSDQRIVTETMATDDFHRPSIQQRELWSATYEFPEHLRDLMAGKKMFIKTYGCQMNEHDSEMMAGLLRAMGYESVAEQDEADIILLNTCAIRENAEAKVFGEIGRLKPMKVRNPELIVGLCGCMAQEEAVRERLSRKFGYVDLVFGTHNIHQLPELVEQARNSQETIFDVWEKAGDVIENMPKLRKEGVRAWVNIQYGCNKFCTYCIVPYTRGRERSRLPVDIVDEVKGLGQSGVKEITLLGQNVNDYGLDLQDVYFAQLLRQVNEVGEIERIRFTTSNPWNFTDDLIEAIALGGKICEHIHLPVQSGNTDVLKRMNRSHTRETYLRLVDRIRNKAPEVSLTTDIIVGFPGETEAQFRDTLRLVEEVQYDNAFTFIYSPRKGTPAAGFEDNVRLEEKKERLQRLMDVQCTISHHINQRLRGQVVEVLVEGESRTNRQVMSGRTRTNKVVLFEASRTMIGKLVHVRVEEALTWTLKGQMIPSPLLVEA